VHDSLPHGVRYPAHPDVGAFPLSCRNFAQTTPVANAILPHIFPSICMAAFQPSRPVPPVRPIVHGVLDRSVRTPIFGEIIMVRLPVLVSGPGSIVSPSAITGANTTNYHPCIVVSSNIVMNPNVGMPVWNLEVFICRSFTELDDSANFVASLDPSLKQQLIPLPWIPALDTPSEFGDPLSVPSYNSRYKSWVTCGSIMVNMGFNSPVSFLISLMCPSSPAILLFSR